MPPTSRSKKKSTTNRSLTQQPSRPPASPASLRNYVLIYINGQRHEVRGAEAGMMLAEFLRRVLQQTGTKVVCAEGDCGACSVLRCFVGGNTSELKSAIFSPINSCITNVAQMDGSSLVTVEGLANFSTDTPMMSPVQDLMIQSHASQCGFCSPGFAVALTGLAEALHGASDRTTLSAKQVQNACTGNLCRCTGYKPLIEAGVALDLSQHTPLTQKYLTKTIRRDLERALRQSLNIETESFHFFAPRKLDLVSRWLARNPRAQVLAGGTDWGVQVNKGRWKPRPLLSLHLIPDLYKLKVLKSNILVGARVTLEDLRLGLGESAPEFCEYLDIFASPQIKHVATLTGNLANASPIGDTLPYLLVSQAEVFALGPSGTRMIPIEKFFRGYRKTALKRSEVILSIGFAPKKENEFIRLWKVSQRRDLDISSLSLAIRLSVNPATQKIKEARIAMGGMAATPIRLRRTEKLLVGVRVEQIDLNSVLAMVQSEVKPIDDLRGSAAYRRVATHQLLQQSWRELKRSLRGPL